MTGDDGDFGPLLYLPSENQEEQLEKLQVLIKETETKMQLTQKELAEVYQYIGRDNPADIVNKPIVNPL